MTARPADKPVFEKTAFPIEMAGWVYVDRETNRVLKITAAPSGIPANWGIAAASEEIDITGRKFFLPLHAQLNAAIQDGSQPPNGREFGNYRKFSGETTLQFEPQ